jgi:hypothetical protein
MYKYKLGKRHHKRHFGILFSIVLCLLGASAYLLVYFHPKSTATIQNAAAIVKHYDGTTGQKAHFDEGTFMVDLPRTWKLVTRNANNFNSWTFQGTNGDDRNRIIMIYEDSLPSKFAVNRVLIVQSQGNRVVHDNDVSDNCINYTSAAAQASPEAVSTKIVTDKWQNVNFLCDIGNYLRNVTGTSSEQGINTVTLTGKTSGVHKFFFTFTDATISPDYTSFYSMLDSFSLK